MNINRSYIIGSLSRKS